MALTADMIRQIFMSKLDPDQEAALLLLILTTCCLGTRADPTALPFLDIVKNNPDPNRADTAKLTPEQQKVLPTLQLVYKNAGGQAFYQNLYALINNQGAAVNTMNTLRGVQASLSDAVTMITNLDNIWVDDPPHPSPASIAMLKC